MRHQAFPETGLVELDDGRRLAFGQAGAPDGMAVLYLHGAIGSPFRRSVELDAVIADLGIRYVLVSRPGFGGSDPRPGRTILDHARDVEALADALGLERFAVVGVSAGGPYALACARELPDRVSSAAAVSSLSPLGHLAARGVAKRLRLPLALLARAPRTCTRAGNLTVSVIERHPRLLLRAMTFGAPPADRSLMAEQEAGDTAVASFLAAASGGGVGEMISDYLLCTRPWGFDPSEIATEVHVWHGIKDQIVPVDHALGLSASMPRGRTWLDPEEGHFFFRRRLPEILGALARPASGAPDGPRVARLQPSAGKAAQPTSPSPDRELALTPAEETVRS